MKQERDGCLALIALSRSRSRLKDHSSRRERLIKLIDQNLAVHAHICIYTYIYLYFCGFDRAIIIPILFIAPVYRSIAFITVRLVDEFKFNPPESDIDNH